MAISPKGSCEVWVSVLPDVELGPVVCVDDELIETIVEGAVLVETVVADVDTELDAEEDERVEVVLEVDEVVDAADKVFTDRYVLMGPSPAGPKSDNARQYLVSDARPDTVKLVLDPMAVADPSQEPQVVP